MRLESAATLRYPRGRPRYSAPSAGWYVILAFLPALDVGRLSP